jgi:hypothetical protein
MYQRWYQPVLGLFTSQAIYPPDLEHPYSYVGSAPPDMVDVEGEWGELGETLGYCSVGDWGGAYRSWINNSPGGQLTRIGGNQDTARGVVYGGMAMAAVGSGGAIAANWAAVSGYTFTWKGGEIVVTNTKLVKEAVRLRINLLGHHSGTGKWVRRLPHYHKRPGIGRHRPWEDDVRRIPFVLPIIVRIRAK